MESTCSLNACALAISDWNDPIFEAVIDATEESVINALFMAETTSGRQGRVLEALLLEKTAEILQQYSRARDDSMP